MRSIHVPLPPFQRILDEHGAAVHRYCLAQAGPDHGPDCFQEAVLAALTAYPKLRDGSNLRSWLFTIAHHKVVDHHRRQARRPQPMPELAAISAAPSPTGPVSGLDLGGGELWAAVGQLPEKQRGAIALRYLADLPYAEIAEVLGCSEAAARQSVRAGLTRLRSEVSR